MIWAAVSSWSYFFPVILPPHQFLVLSIFVIIVMLVGVKWYPTVVSVCMTNDVKHIFLCLFDIVIPSLVSHLLKCFARLYQAVCLAFYWGVLVLFFFNFLLLWLFFLLYNIVLVLPYINMHPPRVYTRVPHPEPRSHLPPHTIPLGHPSAPAPSFLYPASNLDWRFVSYMILYTF